MVGLYSQGNVWIGLRSNLYSHSVGPASVSEWYWTERNLAISQATYFPGTDGMNAASKMCGCMRTDVDKVADFDCAGTVPAAFCEFVPGRD